MAMKNKCVWEYFLKRRKVAEIREDGVLDSPERVAEMLMKTDLQEEEQEHFVVITLDSKRRMRGMTAVTVGLIDRANIHAREVFRVAVLQGAQAIVLAHNHPSGDPTPSAKDIGVTRELVAAGKILGIKVLDHVIVATSLDGCDMSYLSFANENLI